MTAVTTEKAHAKFSASGSDRWLNCPGSIALSKNAPPTPESPYAKEGTQAHAVLETILKAYIAGGKPYSTARMLEKTHPESMVRHCLNAFKWIESEHQKYPNAEVLCETRCDLPVSEPGQFGTTDAAIVELFGRLIVIDFKYGQGIAVSPEENSQAIYYALGIAHKYDYNFESVELVILQPRTEDGQPKRWVTTIEYLMEWREKFEKGIQACNAPNAPLVTGDWCRFCPAAPICPEISNKAMRDAQVEFDVVDGSMAMPVPNASGIQIANLPRILEACDKLETWIGKVREHAFHVLERGEPVPGWKLVQKRSTRKWIDPDKTKLEAMEQFGDDALTDPELKSPAQLEKLGPDVAEWIAPRVSSVSSGLTMVPESDPRQAVNSLETDFTVIGESVEPQQRGKEGKDMATKKKSAKKKPATKKTTKKSK